MRRKPFGRYFWASGALSFWAVFLAVAAAPFPATARGPRQGQLILDCMIDEVTIYIDGKKVGQTPFSKPIMLPAGKHNIKATKPGYSMMESPFVIKAGRKLTLPVDLFPVSGLLKVTANVDGVEVYIDNQMKGHTPLINDLVVGKHTVTLVREGYNDFNTEVNIEAGQKHFVEGVLTPFRDLSPDVLAAAEEQKKRVEMEKQLQERLAAAPEKPVPPPAAWYEGFYRKWWFWTAVGVVVAGAVAIPLATMTGGTQDNLNAHHPAATIQLQLSQ